MSPAEEDILRHLREVQEQRRARTTDSDFGTRVDAIKAYQHARLSNTYADLLGGRRYAGAAKFFLEELYGPHDFAQRDAEFARIVPALVRLFPREVVDTVAALAELHALSEELDSTMARAVDTRQIDRTCYVRAWQRTGRPEDRARQAALTVEIGRALERYTRNRLLARSLRLMRRPARAAGLGALQSFLESGFDTFGAMGGAEEFLGIVAERESAFAARLFSVDLAALEKVTAGGTRGDADPLGQLP